MSASQPARRRTTCGVLIAGGGAVGMMSALALTERGVPVTVLEEGEGLVEQYRASTFHPRPSTCWIATGLRSRSSPPATSPAPSSTATGRRG